MNRDTAVKINELLQQGGKSIQQSIGVLRGQLSDEAFKSYCNAAGEVLAAIQLDLLGPHVYGEHPDLAPTPQANGTDRELVERLQTKFPEVAERVRRGDPPQD